jgi:hypothetical protein
VTTYSAARALGSADERARDHGETGTFLALNGGACAVSAFEGGARSVTAIAWPEWKSRRAVHADVASHGPRYGRPAHRRDAAPGQPGHRPQAAFVPRAAPSRRSRQPSAQAGHAARRGDAHARHGDLVVLSDAGIPTPSKDESVSQQEDDTVGRSFPPEPVSYAVPASGIGELCRIEAEDIDNHRHFSERLARRGLGHVAFVLLRHRPAARNRRPEGPPLRSRKLSRCPRGSRRFVKSGRGSPICSLGHRSRAVSRRTGHRPTPLFYVPWVL